MTFDSLERLIGKQKLSIEYLKDDNMWYFVSRNSKGSFIQESTNLMSLLPDSRDITEGISQIWIHQGKIEIYYDNDDKDFDVFNFTQAIWNRVLCQTSF